jgi:hypothetical protein
MGQQHRAGGSHGLGELIDKYGEGLYPDLLFYYNVDLVDVIEGRGKAPSLVLTLISRLPDTSLTHALLRGGREHFGWGADRHLLADIYDSQNQTTRAAGNWAKKPPEIAPWPRPKTAEKKKPVTVRDLYAQFQRR